MLKVICASILFLSLMITSPACPDIYKYVDESGTIHFTNMPHGSHYEKIMSEKREYSEKDYTRVILRASERFNIDPQIIKALITVESNWDRHAISPKGAMGLMQIMPETASDLHLSNPFDPVQNIEAGTMYLRRLLDRFNGDIELAIAAYNAGPSSVDLWNGIPSFPETKSFVQKVLRCYDRYRSEKPSRIYRISVNDGTFLYTNIPYPEKGSTLSNF